MKVFGEIDLSGITKIVINRAIVWEREREGNEYVWVKTAGGKGFKPKGRIFKFPDEMMWTVNSLLAMDINDPILMELGIHENAYKAWPCGNTLNVVRKDLPKPEPNTPN